MYVNCRAAVADTTHRHLRSDADPHPTGQTGRSATVPHDGEPGEKTVHDALSEN